MAILMYCETNNYIERGQSFMADYRRGCTPGLEDIVLLCEAALDDRAALDALYGIVVEGLSDDFTSNGRKLCNRVLLTVLKTVRQQQIAADFDAYLCSQGYADSELLLQRYDRLLRVKRNISQSIRKVIILSRISIGADVVITSVMVHRLRHYFPFAEIVLVGPDHLEQIFSAMNGVRTIEISYERRGSLLSRIMNCWNAIKVVRQEAMISGMEATLLVDPDSRLSQLGLQPCLPVMQTLYFPSREDCAPGESLLTINNRWLDSVLGVCDFSWPAVSYPAHSLNMAESLYGRIKASRIFVVNFGVGGCGSKRPGGSFELNLLIRLLQEPETVIILDSGKSPIGRERVEGYLEKMRKEEVQTSYLAAEVLTESTIFRHGVIGIRAGIGDVGALIARADGFFGYDSCCQHLAAASQTPGVVLFAGSPNDRFFHRWKPLNRTESIQVIRVRGDGRQINLHESEKLVEEVASRLFRLSG